MRITAHIKIHVMIRALVLFSTLLAISLSSKGDSLPGTITPSPTPAGVGLDSRLAQQVVKELAGYWSIQLPEQLTTDNAINWEQLNEKIRQWNLPFAARNLSLPDIQRHGGPVLLRLRTREGVEEWTILKALGVEQSLIYHRDYDETISNFDLAAQYTNQALVFVSSVQRTSVPNLVVKTPVRTVLVKVLGGTDEITQQVDIQNRGGAPLLLSVLSTSCGCTSAKLSSQSIAPGSKTQLTLKMHASDARLVTVKLKSNDPYWPLAFVGIESQMPPIPVRAPNPIFISQQAEAVTTMPVFINIPLGSKITSIQSSLSFVRATLSPKIVPSTGKYTKREIILQLSSQAPVGRFSGDVAFSLKKSPFTKIVLQVMGYVSDDIIAEPSLIRLGDVAAGSVVKKTITLKAPKSKPFRVINVASQDTSVSSVIDSPTDTAIHTVEINIPVGNSTGTFQKRITLHFSDKRTMDIDIFGKITATAP